MLYLCVRVYANGEAKETVRDQAGYLSWLEYNRKFRWGNTLFVNGKLSDPEKDKGYLGIEEIARIEAVLTEEYEQRQSSLKPDLIGPQWDSYGLSGGYSYTGYRPEPGRKGFAAIMK